MEVAHSIDMMLRRDQTLRQKTLRKKVSLKGVGLHSGKQVNVVIHPAAAQHGIVFMRSDIRGLPRIRADVSRVQKSDLCTMLANQSTSVSTVEHLMAALVGCGIDNALIEVDGPEVPIMDGSAREFVEALDDAGIRELAAPQKVLRLKKKVSVQNGDKFVSAEPSSEFCIKGKIQFGHKLIGEQAFQFDSSDDFKSELAAARTFGFLREVEYLHKKGLVLGGSLENAIVLDEERILNPEGLRFKNEFIRHKILDAVGDFSLLGLSLQATIEIHKAGHELHTGFIRKILEDPSQYEILELGKPLSEEAVVEEISSADEEFVPAWASGY